MPSFLVSGSIAFDTIIQTVGDFRSHDSGWESLSLSLFSPQIRREYGGTAANIAYSLALLGEYPYVIGSVGEDAENALKRLSDMGVNTELVQTVPWNLSAQATIIRDGWAWQINVFHPWAMNFSGEISHGDIIFESAIIAPDAKEGMIRRVRECTMGGIFTIFDPGQAMGIFSGEELREMVTLADMTIMNEPERVTFQSIAGEDYTLITLWLGKIAIETQGEKWVRVFSPSWNIHIPAIHVETLVDATGCGDAFRAGLLYGLERKWSLEKCCQLGNILWGIKIGFMGGQNHTFTREMIDRIGEKEFGVNFFA